MKHQYCVACGAIDDLQHHHLIPKSIGGTDDERNLITLCRSCHGRVHGQNINVVNHSVRTRLGIEKARANGVRIGVSMTPELAQKISERRRRAYTQRLESEESQWIPFVLKMRPQSRWDDVVEEINAATDLQWTAERLKRAVRVYVGKGLLPGSILFSAPRKPSESGPIEAVADLLSEHPSATLRELGEALEARGVRTPRGGAKWSPSSVREAKMRAERKSIRNPPE